MSPRFWKATHDESARERENVHPRIEQAFHPSLKSPAQLSTMYVQLNTQRNMLLCVAMCPARARNVRLQKETQGGAGSYLPLGCKI